MNHSLSEKTAVPLVQELPLNLGAVMSHIIVSFAVVINIASLFRSDDPVLTNWIGVLFTAIAVVVVILTHKLRRKTRRLMAESSENRVRSRLLTKYGLELNKADTYDKSGKYGKTMLNLSDLSQQDVILTFSPDGTDILAFDTDGNPLPVLPRYTR